MPGSLSPVAKANQEIPFPLACQWAGIDVPGDVTESGLKTYCPFGEFAHDDGGSEPSFRIYPDHAYCFAELAWFTPVRLCAEMWDCTPEEAAAEMLSRAGLADPDYREHWKRLVDYRQPVDVDGLVGSLRIFCEFSSRDWKRRQYDKPVADKLAACLRLLGMVRTEQDCRTWLAGCKKAMARVLSEGD